MIYGIDEVGRGAWAGPLVVASVGYEWQVKFEFDDNKRLWRLKDDVQVIVRDSKKLSKKQRDVTNDWLVANVKYEIVSGEASQINEVGIRKVWDDLVVQLAKNSQEKMIVDGSLLPPEITNARCLVRAEESIWGVAAASIIAKVYRDKLMGDLAKVYVGYGWERNVGYGTREHQEGIKRLGLTWQHRKLWVRKLLGR